MARLGPAHADASSRSEEDGYDYGDGDVSYSESHGGSSHLDGAYSDCDTPVHSGRSEYDYERDGSPTEGRSSNSRTSGSNRSRSDDSRSRSGSTAHSRSTAIRSASGSTSSRHPSSDASSHTSGTSTGRSSSESGFDGSQNRKRGDERFEWMRPIDEVSEQDSLDRELSALNYGASAVSGSMDTCKTLSQQDANSDDKSESKRQPEGSVSSQQTPGSKSSHTSSSRRSKDSGSGTTRSSRIRDEASRERTSIKSQSNSRERTSFSSRSHSLDDVDDHSDHRSGASSTRSGSSSKDEKSRQTSTVRRHPPEGGRPVLLEASVGSQGFCNDHSSRASFTSRRSEGSISIAHSISSTKSRLFQGSAVGEHIESEANTSASREPELENSTIIEGGDKNASSAVSSEETLVESESKSHPGSIRLAHPLHQEHQGTEIRNDENTEWQRIVDDNGRRVKSIAVLGTMSDAGKSVIAAAICRILVDGGTRVAPFKAQNMSNNSSAALLPDPMRRERLYKTFERATERDHTATRSPTLDQGYGEIGTAQWLQAEACKIVPRVEMNPVLLKSGGQNENGEYMCSVIVLGKHVVTESYTDLAKRTSSLQSMVLECHHALAEASGAEVIVIEGAGSCTELNLIDRDIANLPLVRALKSPWLLVANIDPGGVFAQIVGTKMCVSERDWDMCAGVIVNKLRGDAKNFEPGPTMLERMVGKPIFVVPFLHDLNLSEEDGMGIERRLEWEKSGSKRKTEIGSSSERKPVVVVIAYPHTAITDDLCPLEQDERFHVEWRRKFVPKPYPATTALILPGSRLTIVDLKWLQDSGWADFIRKHVAAGGRVLGLCGGYQMLGWTVKDPGAVEGTVFARQGIGLLPISTTIGPPECKAVSPRKGQLYPSGIQVEGFELHCGISEVMSERWGLVGKDPGIAPLMALENGKPEGMRLGNVLGTYLHGILRSEKARVELLVPNKREFPSLKSSPTSEDHLDKFARHIESCGLDYKKLRGMIDGGIV